LQASPVPAALRRHIGIHCSTGASGRAYQENWPSGGVAELGLSVIASGVLLPPLSLSYQKASQDAAVDLWFVVFTAAGHDMVYL